MAEKIGAETAALAASTATVKLNEQIVMQTLGKVNKIGGGKAGYGKAGVGNSISDTYDFSKKVLSSVYEGKGTIADADG